MAYTVEKPNWASNKSELQVKRRKREKGIRPKISSDADVDIVRHLRPMQVLFCTHCENRSKQSSALLICLFAALLNKHCISAYIHLLLWKVKLT